MVSQGNWAVRGRRWGEAATAIEERAEALHDAIKMGKVRDIGASSRLGLAIHESALYGEFKRLREQGLRDTLPVVAA